MGYRINRKVVFECSVRSSVAQQPPCPKPRLSSSTQSSITSISAVCHTDLPISNLPVYQQPAPHLVCQKPSGQPVYQRSPYQPPTQAPQNQQSTYMGSTYHQYIPEEPIPEESTPEDRASEESTLERHESEQHTLQQPPAVVLSDQPGSPSNTASTNTRRRQRRRRGRNAPCKSLLLD